MSYTKVDVLKPGDNKGVGGNKKGIITLFDWDEVTGGYAREADGITMNGSLIFGAGAYAVTIYATQHTIKVTSDAEGDPDAKGVMQGLSFDHPGDSVEIRAARQYWMNRNIGAIVESCDGSTTRLLGTPCAPLQLVFKSSDDKDKNATAMEFKSTQKGPDIAEYNGTITLDTVKATLAADETDIDLTNGEGQYQVTESTVADIVIVSISNPQNGMKFTLLGSGGVNKPAIFASSVFILSSGSTWYALAGSQITFKVFKTGTSTYVAIEQSRA